MRNLRDEARWIIGEIDEAKRLAKAVGKPQLGTSSIEAGRVEEYDQDGALVQIIGEQYDGTHAPVTVNGPTPPEPAGLSLTVGVGSVEARWNGKFAGDAVSPMDFSHVSLHGSRPEVFTPSNETQLATIAGELGDVATVILEPGKWTFGLVAVSKAGKWSELSETVTVEIPDYPAPVDIQDELILLDEKYDGVITEAGSLGNRLDQAEQELTAHEGRLEQAETDVNTALSGDVDVERLAIGNGVIRDLVAQHIAGKTAAFQEVDIKNLFVTTGTLTEAVINRLWAEVVMSRKITAQMMAIGSFDNLVPDPSFESWGETGGRDWGGDDAGYVTVSNEAGAARTGNWGMKFASDVPRSTNSYYHDAYISVGAGEYFKAGLHYKVAAGAGSARIRFYEYNSAGTYLRSALGGEDELSAAGWTKTQYARQVSADASYIRIRMYFTATAANTVIYADDVYCNRMNAGELLVDGAVTAEKVAANAIKAYHADFDSFFADTGFVSQLQAKGIRLVNSDGAVTVNLTGEGEKLFTFNNPLDEDETLLAFDEEGGIAAQELNVAGNARMDGVLVAGGDPITEGHLGTEVPGQWGPVFNGRSLLGNTYMTYVEEHPVVSDSYSWLSPLPHGVIANGWNTSTDNLNSKGEWEWEGRNGSTDARMMLVVTADFRDQRMYSLAYRAPAIGDVGGGTTNVGAALVRRSSDGGRVSAGDGAVVPGSRIYLPGGGVYTAATAVTYLRCPEDIPAGRIMLGVEVYVYGNRKAVSSSTSDARRWELTVVDMGVKRPTNDGDEVDLRQRDNSPPPPAPTPKPPAPKQYRETVSASWWQAYTGDNSQATHSTYSGRAAQGRTPYATSNGVMRGLIGFPSQASRLSGATVKKIEVYVYAEKWHAGAGGTAVIGTHGHGSKPGSWSSTSNDVKRQKMKRGDGQWITLPSSVHAGFKSGSLRGISFYPPGGSTSTEYYGLFSGSKTKLRVTYEK